MKTMIFIILILIGKSFYCFSQNAELSQREKYCLDSIARATLREFGDERYSELCKNEKAVITLERVVYHNGYSDENDGRLYYKVLYPNPDSLKSVRLENNYTARVLIWKDSKEAYSIGFGNGYGFPIPQIRESQAKGDTTRYVMPFVTVDFGEIKRQAEINLEIRRQAMEDIQQRDSTHERILSD
mgnify:CR=1 FL=1